LSLGDLGWDEHFAQAFVKASQEGDFAGRVLTFNRHLYFALTEQGQVTALLPGSLRRNAETPEELPAVGDWVVLRPTVTGDAAVIRSVLPRKSRFLRRAAGQVTVQQVVATNVDMVFVVVGLTGDYNLRRIERYLTMVWESGAQPAVLLNKADQVEDAAARVAEVEAVAPGVPVHAISARTGQGLEALAPYLVAGRTVALVGSSGAGKSTLANRLLGAEVQSVTEVRAFDAKGRHTTTQRQMFILPAGGLLIDNPGIRELQLWHADEALSGVFPDVEELAAQCRFADCAHANEPGCRVRAAVEEGTLDPDRLESYRKQVRELDYLAREGDRVAAMREKQRWKVINKWFRKTQKE
jgi:ribosome biogenesis GTPase